MDSVSQGGKVCTYCQKWKPSAELIKPTRSYCRECKRARDRDYYAQNAERVKARTREYEQKNAEKIREGQQREHRVAARRAYEQRPEVKERRAAYRKSEVGKDVQKRGHKKYQQAEIWKTRNRLNQHRRRAAGALTPEEWIAILESYEHRCAYCGVRSDALQMDHVLPVSKGGPTTRENIVPACETCNKKKQANEWTPSPPTA